MRLTKYKLGDLFTQCDEKNDDLLYGPSSVRGISINKTFIVSKADTENIDLSVFKVVHPGCFAWNTATSRNGERISIAFNNSSESIIISSLYAVVFLNDFGKKTVLPEYLYMYFNRSEFDRYARYDSWGSAREYFRFENFSEIEVDIPTLDIQKKYVDIYNTMCVNQQNYEHGLDDLKLVCEGYLDNIRATLPHQRIGDYIELSETRNTDGVFDLDAVRGVSIEKRFIETKADMRGVNLRPYYLVIPGDFAYVTVTSRNGEKISLAFNDSEETYICSSSYVVFRCKDTDKLLPQYLRIYFERSEFNRYSRFNSWGSARETFDWPEMQDVMIPIPDISIQKAISEIFEAYKNRRAISEKLKTQIKDICPILIKGSIEETSA